MLISPLSQFDGALIDGLQFCAMTYALFEQIRSTENGPSRLRMRKTKVEKKLIEELLPICKYVQAKYREGRYISVRWVDGSQQFDAEVVQAGFYVEQGYFPTSTYLEATCVLHGNAHLSRKLLDTNGGSFGLDGIRQIKKDQIESKPVTYRNHEFIQSYSKLILKQIRKKTSIKYPPGTTLIVQCFLNTLYTVDEWEELIAEVRSMQPEHQFCEIFIFDTVAKYFCSL